MNYIVEKTTIKGIEFKILNFKGEKMKIKYSITYSTITPESCEIGDFEDTGFEIEPTTDDLDSIISTAQDLGIFQDVGNWFESEYQTEDYTTNEQKQYSLHFYDITDASYNRIKKILSI